MLVPAPSREGYLAFDSVLSQAAARVSRTTNEYKNITALRGLYSLVVETVFDFLRQMEYKAEQGRIGDYTLDAAKSLTMRAIVDSNAIADHNALLTAIRNEVPAGIPPRFHKAWNLSTIEFVSGVPDNGFNQCFLDLFGRGTEVA